MVDNIIKEINKDSFRQKLCKYTWQAYHILPPIKKPTILDCGCGNGIPTIELAILSKGYIIAVDIDKKSLALLKQKAKALNLTKHIRTRKCNLEKLHFKKYYFDIIWCEGAINSIGFEQAICSWKQFLQSSGFMVIHDQIKDHKRKLKSIPAYGYNLVDKFIISAASWYHEYLKPLEKRILELKNKYKIRQNIIDILNQEAYEIELFKRNPDDFASIFYIMQNRI